MHPSLNGIRAVFFDAVGTLLFPAEPVSATYRRIAAKQGIEIDEETVRSRLLPAFERQERVDHAGGWRTDEAREVERWRTIVTETLEEVPDPTACFQELWQWYSAPLAWQAHPQTAEVLTVLQQHGLILGMASNFDARLHQIIGQMQVFAPVRERCVVSSLTTWRKPASEFFAEVVRLSDSALEEVLFIGDDRRNDYDGAHAAGLRAVLLERTPASGRDDTVRIGELLELLG